jgi:hypothetical protein
MLDIVLGFAFGILPDLLFDCFVEWACTREPWSQGRLKDKFDG